MCLISCQAANLCARIKLLGEARTLSGKRYVNDAIGVVIERTGERVGSEADGRKSAEIDLLQILPFLPILAQAIPDLCT